MNSYEAHFQGSSSSDAGCSYGTRKKNKFSSTTHFSLIYNILIFKGGMSAHVNPFLQLTNVMMRVWVEEIFLKW